MNDRDFQDYSSNVLAWWDDTSHWTKSTVDNANQSTSKRISWLLTW